MPSVDQAALRARNTLVILFILFGGLDAALVILVADVWAIARILLIIAVMYFVVQGRRWAKWLLIGLCGLLAFALVAMLLILGSELSPILVVGSWVMVALSLLIPVYLVINGDLNRYFAHQRQQRHQKSSRAES